MTINATDTEGVSVVARLGYNIGGTAPIGLPAEIRKINSFTPQFCPQIGIDVFKNFGHKWGFMLGARVENKGMREDANVKSYYMELVKGGNKIQGNFTGDEMTFVRQWMITVPLQVTFDIRKVTLKCGPYASVVFNHEFSGYAHGGYLRVDDPTGDKVLLGETADERGDYDFTNDLRNMQFGVNIGADWHIGKRWGAYADLAWGLTGIFNGEFHTIEQTLYPIYGTIGVTYRLY